MNNAVIIDQLLEPSWNPEQYYNNDVDGFEYDSATEFFDAVQALKTTLPETFPSLSFRAFIARYGFTDLVDWDRSMNIFSSQLEPSSDFQPLDSPYYPNELKPKVDNEVSTVFQFVDNPGDAYSFEFALVDPARIGNMPELWLYRGHDFAWKDGIVVAPLAQNFWDVAAITLSGLGDALFSPSNEKQAAIAKLSSENHDLHRSLLTALEATLAKTSHLKFICDDSDSISESEKLKIRIGEIRSAVDRD